VLEEEVAARLGGCLPGAEAARFFKTGAEAVAAAVRVARAYTGREAVLTCGYHGWLDWCQDGAGVPQAAIELKRPVPFNDLAALRAALGDSEPVAAIVIEPVIDEMASAEWLHGLRTAALAASAVLIFDEIKTAFRVEVGGVAERFGITPDLTVVGKALGNGLPIAAVCGQRALMETFTRTWISSTLATEYVSLAAARAVLETYEREGVIDRIATAGARFMAGLERLAGEYPRVVTGLRGIPEMCYLTFRDEQVSAAVAQAAAQRGLLFKRSAYNFMSFAHGDDTVDEILLRLESALEAVNRTC
jgi:glutamate-1-semialdehyde 2,1-aminomutase